MDSGYLTCEDGWFAFLAFIHGSSDLIRPILFCLLIWVLSPLGDAFSKWSAGHDFQPSVSPNAHKQKSWDQSRVAATVSGLLEGAANDADKA